MEKSRAIELLKLAVPIKALTQQEYADFVEAVNMGMDALEQPTSPDTIDRQAVIKVLECWQKAFKENSHHASASDLSLVVKDIRALSATQPVATDTNVGDTISRQAAIDALNHMCSEDENEITVSRANVNSMLKALPSAQPEPKEGHWIPHESPDGGEQYECSECGVLWQFTDGTPEDNEAYFCPKCGARMKGERQK